MSPRRRIDTGTDAALFRLPQPRPHRGRLALIATIAGTVLVASLVISEVVFGNWRGEHQRQIREAAVLSFVRSFVTQYTSPDPFHANDYADKILAMGTGQFAKLYSDKMNEVVLQVARSEPGVGTVQELGVERWNDDGSANVVVVSAMVTTMPDGRKIPTGSRWVVTASREGEQWKVSNLIQVL